LCCLSFFDLRILITPLVSSNSYSIKINQVLVATIKLWWLQLNHWEPFLR
jgi:hypothetical protein